MALEHDVAELQAENSQLRAEINAFRSQNAAQAQELDTLRIESVMLRAKTDREVRRSEAMFTILNQVSQGLISGITRMQAMDRDTKRRQQEDALGVGDDDMPPVGGFRREMETATLPTPTRRAMHFEGKRPSFEVPGAEGDAIHDIDSLNVWQVRSGRWELAGQRPAPNPGGPPEPAPAPVSASPSALPHRTPARDPAITQPPRPGTVRTDIVDSRLPPVDFGPDDDQRALGELAETVLRRGGS